jgi:uncharacterized paraquat-inducible protein A
MPVYFCQKCETSINVPEEWSSQEKSEIAAQAKTAVIQAISLIRKKSHLQLIEAKALATHLTRQGRICHHCKMIQAEDNVTICPQCKALNLNWIS